MSTSKKILVIGGTGNQGGSVIRALLPKGYHIRTITRNPDSPKAERLSENGVEVMKGDLSDYDSLVKAATDMNTVYAMTTMSESGIEGEVKEGIAMADAAKESGVGHFIFGSVASANQKTGIPHFDSKFEVEKHIIKSGIPYTITAPVFFMDNHVSPWSLPALKQGKLKMAMPNNRALQQISLQNIGEFVAAMVERREKVFGKRIDIAGDELTGEETGEKLSKAAGHEIEYQSFNPESLRKDSEDMAIMFEWFNKTGYNVNIEKLRQDYPEVQWQRLDDWAQKQDWSILE